MSRASEDSGCTKIRARAKKKKRLRESWLARDTQHFARTGTGTLAMQATRLREG